MRPICSVALDKRRPAVILTRPVAHARLRSLTVAPVTSTIRGMATEVLLGPRNGLDHECVVNLDDVQTVPVESVHQQIGWLLPDQESALLQAVVAAYDLDA